VVSLVEGAGVSSSAFEHPAAPRSMTESAAAAMVLLNRLFMKVPSFVSLHIHWASRYTF
jgi:hypothetical protein